jgi:hypothetical protein
VILNLSLGQPDRVASALAALSSFYPMDEVTRRMSEAMARLLLNGGEG